MMLYKCHKKLMKGSEIMDIPTRNLSRYVKDKGINISKMSRDTKIPYISLYDSLINDSRDRDLRVGEFFTICDFLDVKCEDFAEEKEVV